MFSPKSKKLTNIVSLVKARVPTDTCMDLTPVSRALYCTKLSVCLVRKKSERKVSDGATSRRILTFLIV